MSRRRREPLSERFWSFLFGSPMGLFAVLGVLVTLLVLTQAPEARSAWGSLTGAADGEPDYEGPTEHDDPGDVDDPQTALFFCNALQRGDTDVLEMIGSEAANAACETVASMRRECAAAGDAGPVLRHACTRLRQFDEAHAER